MKARIVGEDDTLIASVDMAAIPLVGDTLSVNGDRTRCWAVQRRHFHIWEEPNLFNKLPYDSAGGRPSEVTLTCIPATPRTFPYTDQNASLRRPVVPNEGQPSRFREHEAAYAREREARQMDAIEKIVDG